jgi:hypothetical protein
MRFFILALLLATLNSQQAQAASRYVVHEGEVYDNQTKLTWARCSVGQEWKNGHCTGAIRQFTFEEAQKQAGAEWRVPTKDELASLLDQGRKEFPTLDTAAFPDMDASFPWYWSSTPNGSSIGWYFDFKNGYSSGFVSFGNPMAVRLVKISH